MPARAQAAPQRDRRERVAGIAEGGDQEPSRGPLVGPGRRRRDERRAAPARVPASAYRAPAGWVRATSASVRTVLSRPSMSIAIGEAIRVPTPASR